ncbi:MAG: tripartite tricarboxylate transporter TctB family protein, partial [Deltaproteobacteria bacterium]|nr:tripartite tricarboxylate transporter TctB family protein [Deltaproteobacteria bacterium]
MTLAALFFGLTFYFPRQTLAMSPRLFPRVICGGLFFLSMVLLFQALRQRKVASPAQEVEWGIPGWRFGILVLIAFGYTRVLEEAGYLLATPPLIAGVMLLFNEKRGTRIAAVSIATTMLLYILFRMVFRVPLPRFPFF